METNIVEVGPSDCEKLIRLAVDARQPAMVWGPPGVGKSEIMASIAKSLGWDFIDFRAVLRDPVDIRGFPYLNGTENDRKMRWATPSEFPTKKDAKALLFIDELPQAPPLTQAALLQLMLERKCGEYHLPDGVAVICAGNRSQDRAGAHKLISPLLNRMMHIELKVVNEDWYQWAFANNIAPEIISFIKFRPGLLHDFDPNTGAKAFPTPRSWSFVSKLLPNISGNLMLPAIGGCVGQGAAVEFISFVKIYRELPDPQVILKNPGKTPIPSDAAILYALTGSLTALAKKATVSELKAMVVFATRMPDEFSVLLMKDAATVNQAIVSLPEANDWFKKHQSLLNIKAVS
jgi:hypothetical protein